ncbi:MAG: hypothetical protein HY533_01930 [Chloroflexi bacterium]|nr:hypothetical protein [Chloroflexota bacterium]
MNLQEHLKQLIGHDFIINMSDDSDEQGVPPGRLQEVGDNYVLIRTKSEEQGGFANEGAEWFVCLPHLTSLIHMIPECAGCAVETAENLG